MEKDEFGIEVDDEVVAYMKDPKSGLLKKLLEYWDKRKVAEAAKAAADEKARKDKEKKDKPFWEL